MMSILCGGAANAEVIKPVKSSKADIGGAIYARPTAVKDNANGVASTDVVTYDSQDKAFQTGMYKSGPMREENKAPGLDHDEFLYFISGGVKLTSPDGSVLTVNAGESVTIPKGWVGIFETAGYSKIYVIYDADAAKKQGL